MHIKMATEIIKVEIIERQTIKPSSPTPHLLRSLKLSFLDQISPPTYIPLLLYYPFNTNASNNSTTTPTVMCQHLIQSLAKTLSHFYPFAGRLSSGNDAIECNDDGAEFVTARVECSLSEIFKHPDPEMLRRFIPAFELEGGGGVIDKHRIPLLLVQANLFECGGVVLALNVSHRISDCSTTSAFISCWAKTALDDGDDDEQVLPKFGAASYFPPLEEHYFFKSSSNSKSEAPVIEQKSITKRFVFDTSKIATLQSKLATSSSSLPPPPADHHRDHVPSRVVAVSALIWKCAMEASSKSSNTLSIRPSMFIQAADLRRRTGLPENLSGNVVVHAILTYSSEAGNLDIKDLVPKFREGIEKLKETCATDPFDSIAESERVREYENLKRSIYKEHYSCATWCRFNFYDADFGWGKPSWVSIAAIGFNGLIILIDKRDGKGIEAWLSLSEATMELFETNAELLTYASVNPSVT